MELFIMGAVAMACAVATLFFVRFWRKTHDRLFLLFALSFALSGVARLGLAVTASDSEGVTSWYWLRLAAFLLIVIGIVDKNIAQARK